MRHLLVVVSVVSLAACSSAEGDPEPVVEANEPLSNHEHCDTTDANAVIADLGGVTSERVYTHPDCTNGFTVDVFAQSTPSTGLVRWGDTAPNTPELCAQAKILVYVWDKGSNGDPRQAGTSIDTRSAVGTWTNGHCNVPELIGTPPGSLQIHHTYRYAVAARQVAADGSYARRRVTVGIVPVPLVGTGGTAGFP